MNSVLKHERKKLWFNEKWKRSQEWNHLINAILFHVDIITNRSIAGNIRIDEDERDDEGKWNNLVKNYIPKLHC
jgi:hypothetical protein